MRGHLVFTVAADMYALPQHAIDNAIILIAVPYSAFRKLNAQRSLCSVKTFCLAFDVTQTRFLHLVKRVLARLFSFGTNHSKHSCVCGFAIRCGGCPCSFSVALDFPWKCFSRTIKPLTKGIAVVYCIFASARIHVCLLTIDVQMQGLTFWKGFCTRYC